MKITGVQFLSVITLLLCLIVPVRAAFDEVPVSREVPVETEAVFRCRHPTAHNIGWRVNGSLVGRNPPPDITPAIINIDGNLVDTLTIVARLEYNGTIVECVANFADGSPDETSGPPAELLVEADINPTNNSAGDFLTVPLSINVTVGTETMFHCEHLNVDGWSWLINGTALRNQPDLHNTFTESPNGSVQSLTVTALSQYSFTTIECVAFFLNAQPSVLNTPPALLRVQGPLDAVSSLTKIDPTISWEPPFSLDLTNVDPDIVNCVDVYNITCGGRDLVSSDCSVTDTNYTSLSDGYLYEYVVTPRSNVEGAENGTATTLRDALPAFALSSTQLSLSSSGSPSKYQIELVYTPAVPIPSSYAMSLEALDGLGDLDRVEATATEAQPNLLLNVTGLEFRRLWNTTILAFGCQEHSLASIPLSTHDFRDISISSPSAGVVRVNGRFVEGSPSTGVLVIVCGVYSVTLYMSSRDGSGKHEVTIPGLAGGEYTVSVFVVEENGLPFERAAMLPKHQSVKTNTVKAPPPTIEYSLQSTSTGVCVNCNFLDTNASECIAVVYHNLTNIESSHKLNRSGDTASNCIEGVNLMVGVIGGRLTSSAGSPPNSAIDTQWITFLLLQSFMCITSVIMLIISLSIYCLRRGRKDVVMTNIENHHVPSVSVESSVGTHDTISNFVPTLAPSSSYINTNPGQPPAVPASDETTTHYSTVDVTPKPSSSGNASQTSTLAEQSGISPLYSQVDVMPQPVSVQPVDDKRVVYSEVMKTQGANDGLYAMVNLKKSMGGSNPDDLTKVVYSEFHPRGVKSLSHAASAENILAAPTPTPFKTDHVVTALLPVASKWRAIGEAFPLSEKRLDDIETTETHERCLQEMMKAYMLNSDLSHTWDEIVNALKKIEEDSLAEQIFSVHVAPSLPNQAQLPHSDKYTHGLALYPGSGGCWGERGGLVPAACTCANINHVAARKNDPL